MEPGREVQNGAGHDESMAGQSCEFCFQKHRMPVSKREHVSPYENALRSCRKLVHDLFPFLQDVGSDFYKERQAAGVLEGSFSAESDQRQQHTLLWAITFHLNQLRTSNSERLEPALKVVADASRDGWPPRNRQSMG